MIKVAWVHDDGLRHWYGDMPAVYVFDDEKLIREQWSLKRIGFIYECLLEMPVDIRRGQVVAEVADFQKSHKAASIVMKPTPDPHLREQGLKLRAEITDADYFVVIAGKVDLRRFSRYWAKAERALTTRD